MNSKFQSFISNFSYTFLSNIVSMLISTMVVFIIPKLIGVKTYGYWQLYMFYSSYVGFFALGWCDGIYLRYGGKEYLDINKPILISQFWMLAGLESVVGIIISSYIIVFGNANNKFILPMVCVCGVITILRSFLVFILEATNRIKESAWIIFIDRIIYCLMILFILFLKINSYQPLIVADLVAKGVSLTFAAYLCKEVVIGKLVSFGFSLKEAWENIAVGINLMFANIASMLIIGIVRFNIESQWNIETFGKVSLTLSVSNLMMIFINAVGVIMFPMLRRTEVEHLPVMYRLMRTTLMVPLLGLLVFYYPLRLVLSFWLPNYSDSLVYMALLFPICVFESKMAMLINTYLKSLRKEKWILFVNVMTVLLSLITNGIIVLIVKNLTLIIVSIVGLLAFRCILAELILSKYLNLKVIKDVVLEVILTIIFINTCWFIGGFLSVVLYLVIYCCYLLIKRHEITEVIGVTKVLLFGKKQVNIPK